MSEGGRCEPKVPGQGPNGNHEIPCTYSVWREEKTDKTWIRGSSRTLNSDSHSWSHPPLFFLYPKGTTPGILEDVGVGSICSNGSVSTPFRVSSIVKRQVLDLFEVELGPPNRG